MEQQAETVLNQVPAICRQYTTLSVPPHISHITTATADQLLHEQQPTTLEERQRKKIQESVATLPFLCMSMVSQRVLEQYTLFKLISVLTRIASNVLSAWIR